MTRWNCSANAAAPLADRRLEAGDHLLLRVTRPDLPRLQQDHTVQLTTQGQNAGFSLNTEEASGQTVELPAGSTAGASLCSPWFRQRHNATVLALRRGQETVQERLGQVILREGDAPLLQAPIDSIRGLQASNDLWSWTDWRTTSPPCGASPWPSASPSRCCCCRA